jgi:choloylglycine hydrolase
VTDFKEMGIYSVRDMGWCFPLDTELYLSPRGITDNGDAPTGKSLIWTSKYGFTGTRESLKGVYAYADGMNEKGLTIHLQYLGIPENILPARNNNIPGVTWMKLTQYILGNYATVNDVLDNLQNYQIVERKINLKGNNINLPFHFSVSDASGDSAVIEFINEKPVIYHGKQYSAMTNEPSYDQQLKNLEKEKQNGHYVNSTLVGGTSTTSRFVRASYYSESDVLLIPANQQQAVTLLLSAMLNTNVPIYNGFGNCDFSGKTYKINDKVNDDWASLYQTVSDLTHKKYYFYSDLIGNRLEVNLNEANLSIGQPFKVLNALDPQLHGDITDKFKSDTRKIN